MSSISYTVSGSLTSSTNVSIKKNGETLERCLTNCSGLSNGNYSSLFNDNDLQKGVTHSIILSLINNTCINSSTVNICCPAVGGGIVGNLNPSSNTTQNYTVNGTDGNYSESGSNGGFSITGGNASFIGIPSGGIASINVGTTPFTLCYNILSCGQPRSICIEITPQIIGCSLTVSNISISC